MKECISHHYACDCREQKFAELEKNAKRYEKLRRLNPREFEELWRAALENRYFDDLVDEL